MTTSALASDHAAVIRDRLKDYVHGGKFFTSEEIGALIRRMNTVVSLAKETEEENRALGRQLAIVRHNVGPAPEGNNVVPFPGRRPAHHGR
jgi:hypothetical protein